MRFISLFLLLMFLVHFNVQAEESDRIAIISEKDAKNFKFILPEETSGFWTTRREDIDRMDYAIKEHLKSIIADQDIDSYEREKAKTVLEEFISYWRQYIGIIVKGQKRVFCNSGAFGPGDWKSQPVFAFDGGTAFWRIQYLLKENKCIDFNTNGEA